MIRTMVKPVKRLAAFIDSDVYQRLSTLSTMRRLQPRFANALHCQCREEVWDAAIANIGSQTAVLFLEFGVFEGYSIRYFSDRLKHPDSRFFGFDSFEGLPERWGQMAAGTFSTEGRIPSVDDPRVSFVRGWFQDSLPQFLESLRNHAERHDCVIFVHFDADLYSSTLFLLATLWARFDRYQFCFDEFMGHELRAIQDFSTAFPVAIEYVAYDSKDGFPIHVYGRLRKVSNARRLPDDPALSPS